MSAKRQKKKTLAFVDCDERIDMAETCQILRDGKARCASCVEERAAGK